MQQVSKEKAQKPYPIVPADGQIVLQIRHRKTQRLHATHTVTASAIQQVRTLGVALLNPNPPQIRC